MILGIAGSLREGSHNARLLQAAARALPDVDLRSYEGLANVPPYSEDGAPDQAVLELRRVVEAADAVLIATPEYNGSIPGQLKNALDWASRPHRRGAFKGKPVAVVGASTGLSGAVWAQADLRRVLGRMGARVIDAELPVGQAADAFDTQGHLRDPELDARLREILDRLVDAVDPAPVSTPSA